MFKLAICISLCFVGVNCCFSRSKPEPKPVVVEKVHSQQAHASNTGRSLNTGGEVTPAELKTLTEELIKMDQNNVASQVHINIQNRAPHSPTGDAARYPLFKSHSRSAVSGPTITAYKALMDNYVENAAAKDIPTAHEKAEEAKFLDLVMKTPIMIRTESFLKQKGLIRGSLRSTLQEIWFTPYSRIRGSVGSSGFEHVFLGELKNGEVSGLHNWVYFQKEEAEGDLNYKGYIKSLDLGNKGKVLKVKFDWMHKPKTVGSLFVGTSPELEMAVYTVCFYARRNKGCNIQMNNKKFRVKVYSYSYKGKQLIGSAFPDVF